MSLVASSMATGLAIGAPIAGISLAIDAALGLASRAAPQMNLQETGTPLRILAGGAVAWLAIGVISARLADAVSATPEAIARVLGG